MRIVFSGACGLFLLWIALSTAYSQRVNQYSVEAGGMAASGQTPFWMRANQYGTVPLNTPFLRLNAALYSPYRPADSLGHRPKFDWGYGANVVVNAGKTSQFLLPEAYLKGRIGAFELYVGRRKEIVGLVDTLMTSGAYIWSGNALPIPKVQFGLHNFTPIPFTKGILSVMGVIAHGWFEDSDRLVKDSYLHQKYFYGRLGKPTWPVRFYGGFNHQVIWAGYADPKVLGPVVSMNGKLPSSLSNFPAVLFGTRGDPMDKTITSFEWNRIGNHLGSVDAALEVDLNHLNFYAYRQFVYDDGSLFYGTNLADGLNGLRIRNKNQPSGSAFFLRQITLEYLYTGSQGGSVFVIDDEKLRGRDDYFNHSQFLDGWTYFGRTIGTPFLTPQRELKPGTPDHGVGISNNRVSVAHFGLSALLLNKIELTGRLSYSSNAGTYAIPYPAKPRQISGLLTAALPVNLLGGTMLSGSLGVDSGELLPTSTGVYLGLRKTGFLGRSGGYQPASRVSGSRWAN